MTYMLPTKQVVRLSDKLKSNQFSLQDISIPAAIFTNGQLVENNEAFHQLLPAGSLEHKLISRHSTIRQVSKELTIVPDSLSFNLILDRRVLRGVASPVDQRPRQVLIFFEDISSQIQSEKNTALLYRLSLLLSASNQSLEEKLQDAVDHILFEFPCYDSSIYIRDRERKDLYQIAWGTTDIKSARVISREHLKLGRGIVGRVAKSLKPIVVANILADRRFVRRPGDKMPLAMLAVPLVLHDELFGVLTVTRLPQQNFLDQEVQLFTMIATRLASVIENSQINETILNEKNKLDQILTTLRDGLVLYTVDRRVALVNQTAKRLLGLKKDITNLSWKDIFERHPERYTSYQLERDFNPMEFLELAIDHGKTSTGLATLESQPPKMVEIIVAPVYDRSGQISGALSHLRDISQMHELQAKMASRVQQLTYLFRISSITGYNTLQIVRRTLRQVLPLLSVKACQLRLIDEQTETLRVIETAGNARLINQIELKISKKIKQAIHRQQPQLLRIKIDEQPLPTLITPIIGHQSGSRGVLIVADRENHRYFAREDLNLLSIVSTQLAAKLDNAQLLGEIEHDRNKLAAIIDQSVDGILVIDKDQAVQVWNHALERLTGIEEDEIVRYPVSEAEQMVEILDRIQNNEFVEVRIRHRKTGQPVWLGIASAPLTQGRETSGHVAIVRDISRQKELETAKNEFVSTASHELRSPITAIVGYLSMLRRGDAGQIINKQQAFFVDKAYQNAKRMVGLVETLLTTTRTESGQVRYQLEPINIIDMFDSIVSDLRFKTEDKRLKLTINRRSSVPVIADYDAIHQVFSNIITNAIKYTPNGGRVEISFQPSREQGQAMLVTQIKDTGVGIDSLYQEKVFEKFARVDNPLSISAGGAGLGLYLARKIIEQLGGRIWLKSEKGKGSSFFISLPIASNQLIRKEIG